MSRLILPQAVRGFIACVGGRGFDEKKNVADPVLRCFQAAYPDALTYFAATRVDGDQTEEPSLVIDDGLVKSREQLFETPDLQDTLHWAYPIKKSIAPPPDGADPGRIRHMGLLKFLYGADRKAVRKHLVDVRWLPGLSQRVIKFNGRHGAAAALQSVSDELAQLPRKFHKYILKTNGTFNWRYIKGTTRLSAHAFAIAIDLDIRHTDYWRWARDKQGRFKFRNRIPIEIVEVFEKNGFIWGGRWWHFDTMHFEYRPEFFESECMAKR
ncbi:MAG: M15 family metallopeptidase [Myxococcota bacterium]|nr:M15 family metallopeptidase [Myxococcota bacterium]